MAIKFATKKDIMDNINILDIAYEFGIGTEEAYSGNFNYKCKCPSSEHKNGNERTGSCYIDSINNNYWCFGCGSGSNVIDFYMACADVDFGTALSTLGKRVSSGIKRSSSVRSIQPSSNFLILLKISKLLRETILNHPKDLKWINNLMKKVDEYISNIDTHDCEKTQALYKKISDTIEKRYK